MEVSDPTRRRIACKQDKSLGLNRRFRIQEPEKLCPGMSRRRPGSIVDPWSCSSARSAGRARRGARRGRPRRRPGRLRHRRAGDRQDLARHPVPATISTPRRGCCSAPATTSRSRGRSARSATSPGASRRRSSDALVSGRRARTSIQTLLVAELELPPRPTVLVLEDVHWADDATLDSITVLGRRIGSLPALLVLTFRGGEAPPGIRCTRPSARSAPSDSVFVELAPLSEGAVASLAGDGARRGVRRDRRQPVLRHRAARAPQPPTDLPPSVANAVLGRASRLDDALAPPGGARLGRAEPRADVACSTR